MLPVEQPNTIEGMDLIADIGATNTRCALLNDRGEQRSAEVFSNAEFESLEALLERYLEQQAGQGGARRAALAIAAPVVADRVAMVNIDWAFSQSELERRLGLDELLVVNDFEALARSLPELGPSDLHEVGRASAEDDTRAAKAVLGPGSGLGMAGLVPSGSGWAVVGGEGGHVTAPAASDAEQAVVAAVRRRRGHCSAEMLLSGPGLVTLYRALAEIEGGEARHVLPQDVTALAEQGDALAGRALETFFAMLGTVASDLALILGARGGLYIGGGIVPRLKDALDRSAFRERFVDKGEYREYLEAIPTRLITAPLPALRGLRALLGYGSTHG